MDSLFAAARHSLSFILRSFRNQTIEARRRPAAFEGSEGRRGFIERVLWRGFAETVDLKEGFLGEETRERL